jgi:hypothetical protein
MHYRRTTIVLVVLGFIWPGGAAYVVYVYEQHVSTSKREQVMPLKIGNYLPDELAITHATGMLSPGGSSR